MTTLESQVVAIIGAGQSGANVAKSLRSEGFVGKILLFGDEPHSPYERPPLSKSVLAGDDRHLSSTLLSEADAAERKIEMHLSTTVVSVDLDAKTLMLDSGARVGFDELVFATGGSPRRLGILDPSGKKVFALRNRTDATLLRNELHRAPSILIVGGGWIGLEVAATARKLGCAVTLVETTERLCTRGAPAILSAYLAQLHRERGVMLHLATSIRSIALNEDGVSATLSTGEIVEADLVVEGLGLEPNDQLAIQAGLACNGGIATLPCGKTDREGIWAVGDVAVFDRPSDLGVGRLESWANANEQALLCARSIVRGTTEPYEASAWFWSDQYIVNIQLCGRYPDGSEFAVRGDPTDTTDGTTWSALAMHNGALVGAVVANDPQSAKAARRLLDRGFSDLEALRDPNQTLMSLLKRS
jgi:3-phenylpropionate/trans-cinnamate dioxygenase ferredoxin reductase component